MPSSAPSLPTLPGSALSGAEKTVLAKLSPALQQPPEPKALRLLLADAKAQGLDPEKLYQLAVQVRSPAWVPAPPYPEVRPA